MTPTTTIESADKPKKQKKIRHAIHFVPAFNGTARGSLVGDFIECDDSNYVILYEEYEASHSRSHLVPWRQVQSITTFWVSAETSDEG